MKEKAQSKDKDPVTTSQPEPKAKADEKKADTASDGSVAAAKPTAVPAPAKPGADKAKIFSKPPQKTFMPPRGGKGGGGGGAIRQMRSQRGR